MLWKRRWFGVGFIVALLGLWEIAAATRYDAGDELPAHERHYGDLVGAHRIGRTSGELVPSLWRMFAGYFVGVALGVALGLLMGYFRFFYSLLEPITEVLRPIPSPAYLPIVILFLGIDERDEDLHDRICFVLSGSAQHL